LIQEHEGIIYKISRVYFDQEEDQKDLYQEIVYQLWKSYDSFDDRSKWSTWMYRVALNTAISFLKRDKSKLKKVSSEGLDNFKMEPFDPVMEERIEWLYKSIQELSVVEKGIILLYLEGKRHDEIASITGFSTTNVGTRISRIKEKLKHQISN
jgi:RNA polymerase sigma-70 factor (ECF subfamily)